MPSILDTLPALYRDLLPPFFRSPIPEETKATCAACPMCASGGADRVDPVDGVARTFRPDTKCCTYHPRLPNYLVGALLADSDPALEEGRRRVRAKLASGVGVHPLWLKPPARFTLLYGNGRQFFGRTESLRCPYYDVGGGGCTIWKFRESVCSTFYCRYVAGADGRRFWMSLKSFLALVELQLSRYAVLQLLPELVHEAKDKEEILSGPGGPLGADDLDERPLPPKAHAALWGEWSGREEALYRAAFDA
ncbi:MAG: hypothetical protein ACK4N5_03945, partial [Myxococcales bacterium]